MAVTNTMAHYRQHKWKHCKWNRNKIAFAKYLALGFIILTQLGLIIFYVSIYHSAQQQCSDLYKTPSTLRSSPRRFPSAEWELYGWSSNTSRNVNDYIYPEKDTAILNPKNICNEGPYLLIVVCSAVSNLDARNAIRNTWGNNSYLDAVYESPVKVVFLLGQSESYINNSRAADENHLYNDMIQESFLDTYNNLTLKSLMILKWVTRNCDKLTYVMKTDDDIFINVPVIMKILKRRFKSTGTLIGSVLSGEKPDRDPFSKWYVPRYMYSKRFYPNFLSGIGYVISSDVAKLLYEAALSTPFLYLEDVYVTGLLPERVGLIPENESRISHLVRKLHICSVQHFVTTHYINASTMHFLWNKLNEPAIETTCANRFGKLITRAQQYTPRYKVITKPLSVIN